MTCIGRTYFEEQKVKWKAILDAAHDTLVAAVSEQIQMYELETTEGRHKVVDKQIKNLEKAINNATRQYEYWCNRLAGKGIIAIKSRRKPGN